MRIALLLSAVALLASAAPIATDAGSVNVIEARDALPKPLPESASTTEQPAKHHWWRHRVRPAVEQAKTDSVKAAKEAKKKADDKKIRPIDFLKSAGSGATSAIVGSLFGR